MTSLTRELSEATRRCHQAWRETIRSPGASTQAAHDKAGAELEAARKRIQAYLYGNVGR
jgi:hypothetical protein